MRSYLQLGEIIWEDGMTLSYQDRLKAIVNNLGITLKSDEFYSLRLVDSNKREFKLSCTDSGRVFVKPKGAPRSAHTMPMDREYFPLFVMGPDETRRRIFEVAPVDHSKPINDNDEQQPTPKSDDNTDEMKSDEPVKGGQS